MTSKWLLLLLLCCAPALAQNSGTPESDVPEVHFYTFRSSWQAPPLRTNKEVFKSKVFVGSRALAFTAMGLACADRRTGESLHSELPAMLAVTAMDYLMFRFVSGFHGLIGSSYATQHYLRARVK